MSDVHIYSSDVAFTPAVKAIQTRKGSRDGYAQVEENGGWRTEVDERLAASLAEANSFYLATAMKAAMASMRSMGLFHIPQ